MHCLSMAYSIPSLQQNSPHTLHIRTKRACIALMDTSSYHPSYSRIQLGSMTKKNPIDRQARGHMIRDLRSCTTVLSKQATGFLPLNALFALLFDKIIKAPLQPDWSGPPCKTHSCTNRDGVFCSNEQARISKGIQLTIGFCQRLFPLHAPHLSYLLRAYLASSRRSFLFFALFSICSTPRKALLRREGLSAHPSPPRGAIGFSYSPYSPLYLPT